MNECIEDRLKAEARALGFELAGIARATAADGFERFSHWLANGFAGEMDYLHRNASSRRHPESILPDVRSVLMLGMTYGGAGPRAGQGQVAKYAQSTDYHRYIWDKLNLLGAWLDAEIPGTTSHGVTDTAPLLERDFARRAGLGWFGKNTMLLNREHGSYFLLSALLTTMNLSPDASFEGGHCGTCTACLDSCPTHAFVEPGVLDARRCISYLTIELKTSVPEQLRSDIGDRLFGCDVCQDVCPWNDHRTITSGLPHRPDLVSIDSVELLAMAPNELRRRFKGTALRRANWRGLLRNAAIVLGNQKNPDALPHLRTAMSWNDDVVREACRWAIEQIEASQVPAAT